MWRAVPADAKEISTGPQDRFDTVVLFEPADESITTSTIGGSS